MNPPALSHLGDGVYLLDACYQRPGHTGVYLVTGENEAVIVEAGTSHTTPLVLQALEALGLSAEAVSWVMPTHVHLDHAGGAGSLMAALPNARLLVHPRGARHLIDPTRLVASAASVYGEERMAELYGEVVPVPAERVAEAVDGMRIAAAGREFLVLDVPGHARHHYVLFDELSRGLFTGDSFGLSFRDFDVDGRPWVMATTTPTQFDPEGWLESLGRMLALAPKAAFLTHFGPVAEVARLGEILAGQIRHHAELARSLAGEADPQGALEKALAGYYLAELAEHGVEADRATEILAPEVALNAQGLAFWLASD